MKFAGQNDLAAERAVLSSIVLENSTFDEVGDILTPSDFYSWTNGAVFGAMVALRARGEEIDPITLRAELESTKQLERVGGDEVLLSLTSDIPNTAAIETYARRIAKLATVRAMVTAATRVAARGREPIEDLDAFLDESEAELHAVAMARRADRRCRSMKELVIAVWEDIVNRSETGAIRGLRSGLASLDTTLSGLRRQHLIVVAGRPGMGKTALALHVMRAVASAGGPVLGWSGEMPAEEWTERKLVAQAGVQGDAVRAGTFTREDMARLQSAASVLTGLPIEVDDTPAISVWQLRSKARRMKARGGLALVVVDYLQLMRTGERHGSREQEVAAVSRSLKALAKELDVPVMALAQLNRLAERATDKRPSMADLRESGQIEQDADAILLLYREGYYDKEASQTEAEIIVAKQRGGRTATLRTFFDPDTMRWGDLERTARDEPFQRAPGGVWDPRGNDEPESWETEL